MCRYKNNDKNNSTKNDSSNKYDIRFILILAIGFTAIFTLLVVMTAYEKRADYISVVVTEPAVSSFLVKGKIDINNATAEELTELEGIGDILAGRIVDYRNKNGKFFSTDELMEVSGIGENLFEKISEDICVILSETESELLNISDSLAESESENEAFSIIDDKTPEIDNNLININTATAEELMTLKGIGEVISGRIIEYREQNGGFSDIEQIKNVSGIGDVVFENIKNYIVID